MNLAKHKPLVIKSAVVMLLAFLLPLFFQSGARVAGPWSLMPPFVAILLAFVSGQLMVSLGFAIILGAFLINQDSSSSFFSASLGGVSQTMEYFYSAGTSLANLQILGFVFFILSMVHVMTVSGGLHAMVDRMKKFIVGRRSAEFMTAVLGLFIFIDDYANTMIVGSTMKSVTDKFKISRAKLAFLVDATSAPIAGVALVSTWIGYEVGLFGDMAKKFAWGMDGYSVFLDALGFRFYCFFMLFFVFANVISGVDFGPMTKSKPVLHGADTPSVGRKSLVCSLWPLGTLLSLVFGLLWYDGGGTAQGMSLFSFSSWRSVLTSSENGIFILLTSSFIAWLVANITAVFFAKLPLKKLLEAFVGGVKSAILPATILILAWSLKAVCDDLQAGEYIVSLLGDKVNPMWLPLAIFVISALTAFSTGTSWGTMAILIPTVTPLAVELSGGAYGPFVALCLASILDGAIMGDHCSPVSDTTIMSTISTECDLIEHVKTQLPYSLIVGAMALLFGYLPQAAGWSLGLSFMMGLGAILTLFTVLQRVRRLKKA